MVKIMRFRKPAFSEIQKNFLEKFIRCLKKDFKGEQLALAARIGCDQSSISRWANKETAPPDYACRLLLKELGAGSFKQSLGQRVQHLRENIFQISPREFAWTFKLDSVSQLEAVERGEVELPRESIEMLMRDYQVSASHLDYGDKLIFNKIPHTPESIQDYLKKGFTLHIVTPPHGHEDRAWLRCRFILHRERELLPQCLMTSTEGSFRSTGGGLLMIEHALWAIVESVGGPGAHVPTVVMTDKSAWKEMQASSFYAKKIAFGAGSVDVPCDEKLREIYESAAKQFESQRKFKERRETVVPVKKRDQPS